MRFVIYILLVKFFFMASFCLGALEQRTVEPPSPVVSEVELSEIQIKFPFLGKVRGRGVNVRSGGNLNYEVLARLQEGDVVLVLAEAYGWYQIIPPEGVYLWIHQSNLKEDQVVSDSVNVRSRPSLGGAINCQVNQGDTVDAIAKEGEWIKIMAPKNAKAWVYKDYVIYERPYTEGLKEIPGLALARRGGEEQDKTRREALRKEQLLKEAQQLEQEEFYKPVDQTQMDEVIKRYQTLMNEFPLDQQLHNDVQKKIENLKHRKEKLEVAVQPAQEFRPPALPKTASRGGSGPFEVFHGKLESGSGFGKNKRYKLIQNRRRVCILLESDPSLESFLHQEVKVQGAIVSWIYAYVPLVRVQKIEPDP